MMEGTPDSIDTTQLAKDISKLNDIVDVHDLHVWQISQGKLFRAFVIGDLKRKNRDRKADEV